MKPIVRQIQIVGHCGPTCVSMMLECYGHSVSPFEIADAAGVSGSIELHGSRIDQLAFAVSKVAPGFVLLGKFESDLELLIRLTEEMRVPVGVEWQGSFRRDDGTTFDVGHYSILTGVNLPRGTMSIVDPDAQSCFSDGSVDIVDFLSRWWEDNEVSAGVNARSSRLSFVICQKGSSAIFLNLGFQLVDWEMVRAASIDL
jgi:hypothetical protein